VPDERKPELGDRAPGSPPGPPAAVPPGEGQAQAAAPPEPPGSGPDPARSRLLLAGVCGCAFIAIVGLGIKWSAERRADADCRRRLELLWSAAQKYAAENNGKFPCGPRATEELVLRYLRHQRYWNCPQTDSGYFWTRRPRKLGDDPRWLLAWELKPHGWPLGRRRALFVDGRIVALSGSEYEADLARERSEPLPPPPAVQPKPDLREDPENPPPGWRLPRKPVEPGKPAGAGPAPAPAPADPKRQPGK